MLGLNGWTRQDVSGRVELFFDPVVVLTSLFCVTLLSPRGRGRTAQSSDRVPKGEPNILDPNHFALPLIRSLFTLLHPIELVITPDRRSRGLIRNNAHTLPNKAAFRIIPCPRTFPRPSDCPERRRTGYGRPDI